MKTRKMKRIMFITAAIIGVVMLIAGILAQLLLNEPKYLAFAGGFGLGITIVAIVNLLMMKKHPEKKKEEEICEKDERQVQIRSRAAQNVYFISLFGMVGVELIFLILDYWIPCFIIIGLMAFHVISYALSIRHYENKM